jgi:integrase
VDRNIAATALYAGLRKGELFGLEKRDVDLNRRLLTVRRSYDSDTTKGGREEAVPIAAALVPYLEAALDASKGALLFPRTDGGRRTEADKLGKRIQTALKHAGIVEGFDDLATGWSSSPGAGWGHTAAAQSVQKIVDSKANDLPKYREAFQYRLLLLFSGEDGPGSFINVPADIRVFTSGFDAVFFQRALGSTRCIGGLPPVAQVSTQAD